MRSILSMDACQQILDRSRPQGQFDSFSDNSNTCISVTGQPLTTKGSLKTQIMFPASDHLYHIDFLVWDNMSKSLNCILGWDFLVAHRLQLSLLGDRYMLVGPHGSTSLVPLSLPHQGLSPSDVVSASMAHLTPDQNLPMFAQSSTQGPVKVTLSSAVFIPSRSECVVQCKVPPSCSNRLGMISQKNAESQFYVAYSVSVATNRHVFVKIMNPFQETVEFHVGQSIAEFFPISELPTFPNNCNTTVDICTTLDSTQDILDGTLEDLTAAINPKLSKHDQDQILQTLLSFSDVFHDSLGHTAVTSHKIETGNTPPIRRHPRRLPYHYRAEVNAQVDKMLSQGLSSLAPAPGLPQWFL